MIPCDLWTRLEEVFAMRVEMRQREAAQTYLSLLTRWSGRMNLMRWGSCEEFLRRHFMEGLWLADRFLAEEAGAVDVGSGAGFPGLPAKVRRPSMELHLLEPSLRKCAFLRVACRRLRVAGVHVHEGRGEDWPGWQADRLAMMRALKPSAELCGLLAEKRVRLLLLHGEGGGDVFGAQALDRAGVPGSRGLYASLLSW